MTRYEVQRGDCLANIAARFKTTWKALWDANPALRELRKQPGVLYPGDIVEIPSTPVPVFVVETNKVHTFIVTRPVHDLRVRFAAGHEHPYANTSIRLEIDGALQETTTDGDGFATFKIPAGAREGKAYLGDDEFGFPVRFGDLDPVDTDTGLQARLRHLGYYMNEVDNDVGPWTRRALLAFQLDASLDPTGEYDDATRRELEKRSGA